MANIQVSQSNPTRRTSVFVPLIIGLAMVLLLSAACGPKPPAPMPEANMDTNTSAPTRPAPEPVDRPPVTTPDRDEKPSWYSLELEETEKNLYQQGLLGTVYFAYDSSSLDDRARDRLKKNADFFKANPGFRFVVEGHCDERGTSEYNLALGDRRASSAMSYLSSLGLRGSNMRTISYGEEKGVCASASESCWSQNRRAYFKLTSQPE